MASVSTADVERRESSELLRSGAWLMTIAGVAFIGYGIILVDVPIEKGA